MSEELEIFKKKLLYRASYRGTKEMDILLTKFVKKYVNVFSHEQLNPCRIVPKGPENIFKEAEQ